jgi:hypothetical protein
VEAYFRKVADDAEQRLAGKLYARGNGTIFPNFSFAPGFPRSFAVWHPRGPLVTEGWRWVLVDADAPQEVKDRLRHHVMWYSGPQGMTEQDDMENWKYATDASRGTIARRYPYNYQMGMGKSRPVETLKDAVFTPFMSETNQLAYYRRWAELMEANSWNELHPKRRTGGNGH